MTEDPRTMGDYRDYRLVDSLGSGAMDVVVLAISQRGPRCLVVGPIAGAHPFFARLSPDTAAHCK